MRAHRDAPLVCRLQARLAQRTQKAGSMFYEGVQLLIAKTWRFQRIRHVPCRDRSEGNNQSPTLMKNNLLDSFLASVIIGTFVLSFAYIGSVAAQTAVAPRGTTAAVAPPGGNLPVQPHGVSTGNGALAATPSSGAVNQSSATTAPAATQNNTIQPVNPQTGAPQAATPNGNSPQNMTPASGQAPAQGATTNNAGQPASGSAAQ